MQLPFGTRFKPGKCRVSQIKQEINMTNKELQGLIDRKRWTTFLVNLPLGQSLWFLKSPRDVKSLKAIAYDKNSDKDGRNYNFKVDKNHVAVIINVTKHEEGAAIQ